MKQISNLIICLVTLSIILCIGFLIISSSNWWPIQVTPKPENDDGLRTIEFNEKDNLIMDDVMEIMEGDKI